MYCFISCKRKWLLRGILALPSESVLLISEKVSVKNQNILYIKKHMKEKNIFNLIKILF